jgi:hypothetical protein
VDDFWRRSKHFHLLQFLLVCSNVKGCGEWSQVSKKQIAKRFWKTTTVEELHKQNQKLCKELMEHYEKESKEFVTTYPGVSAYSEEACKELARSMERMPSYEHDPNPSGGRTFYRNQKKRDVCKGYIKFVQ